MEKTENKTEQIDLSILLSDLVRVLRQIWLPGLVLVLILTAAVTFRDYRGYQPMYEASASFTVKVVNPLYASASGYNAQTAEQMEKTFPYILSSNALRERVKKYLDISSLPSVQAEVITGTNVFTLRVQAADPQRAYDVLNAVMTCYPEVAELVIGPSVMVMLDESGVPSQPYNSFSLTRSALKGAVLGSILLLAVAAVLAFARKTVHDEKELKQLLNCSCLGALPATKVVGKDVSCPLTIDDHGKHGFSKAVDLLCLHVEKEMKAAGRQVLMISSAIPSEGKTTVASNLAISLAQKGNRVLLMDCDLRNPSVAEVFRISNSNGLSDFLEGRISSKDILKRTKTPNLYVITGGTSQEHSPVDLLSNKGLGKMIDATKKIFDYVILDTSPCGILADASEVAELAECAVMVVRKDYASHNQILDGIRYLTDSKLPLLGSVLNGTRFFDHYGYGYHYGYSYGYGRKPS